MNKVLIADNLTLFTHPLNQEFHLFITKWKTPSFQRKINKERVDKMIKQQSKTFQLGGVFELCRWKNELYLVDGQHRKEMLVHFFSEKKFYPSLLAVVKIKEVKSEDEIFEWFQFVNESTPVEFYEKSLTYKQVEYISNYIFQNWPSSISSKTNHQCHKINLVRFGNFLTKLNCLKKEWNQSQSEEFLIKLNEKFRKKSKEIKMTKNQLEECEKLDFYLGLYVKVEDKIFII